ncbi:MAG: ArsR family transcriptional regulator [Candidatus Heimdallarchaeota archaeon]|nr:ArsR family transcriptional regulator [Candidatus Heimdallarchaeota archaeon]
MKLIDEFPCDIDHPILSIIDSETRRHIIHLLATEKNYGNRLASILNLSSPAIHRHLKRLQKHQNESTSVSILGTKEKTRESFSGYKGAKATIFEIISNLTLFFGIFPNFIHSQVVEILSDGQRKTRRIDPDNFDPNLFGVKIQRGESLKDCVGEDCFDTHVEKINEINKQISDHQDFLMDLLYLKNEVIEKIFMIIEEAEDLSFEERVVLKSLIAYGFNNIKLIANLLNTDENEIRFHIEKLKKKKWIVDKEIKKIEIDSD